MKKTKTWDDNLNDVVRDVFFVDSDLLDAMMIPKNTRNNVVDFVENRFIRDPAPDELITTEDVRVCYYRSQGRSLGYHVNKRFIWMDVYVKTDHLHDYDNDLLKYRTDVICQRIKELLLSKKYVCNLRFEYEDGPYELYTKLVGYRRTRIVFSYKTTY